MDYPAEFQGTSQDTLNKLGVSKVMTLTSRPTTTGSSRAPPPASSCAIVSQLLLGENDFYDEIFKALRIPYEPVRWLKDIDASHDDDVTKAARVFELIHSYRVRGHVMADTDPLEYQPAQAPRPRHHRARAHPVGPGARVRGRRLRRQVDDEAARHPRRAARLVLPHHRHRVHAHPGPEAAQVDPGPRRALARQAGARGAAAHPAPAERRRGVRDVPADEVRRPEALLAGGRRVRHPAAGRGHRLGRRVAPGRGRHRHGPPRPAERPREHRRQVVRADLPRVRGQPRPEVDARLRRREVPPGRRGHLHRPGRRADQGLAGRQPLPPGGGRPGRRGHRPRQAGHHQQGRHGLHGPAGRRCTATRPSRARAWSPRR